MRRPSVLLVPLLLGLSVLAACKGGVSTPDEYREAAAPIEGALAGVATAAQTARIGSDPPEFGRNLGTVLGPLRELQNAITTVRVDDPDLLALHQALEAAVATHLAAVEGIAETVSMTPLKDSKGRYLESEERFEQAVAGWRAAVQGL